MAILLTCRHAALVSDRIGRQGRLIILRLSAFIALSIGAQIAWNGTKALLTWIGVP